MSEANVLAGISLNMTIVFLDSRVARAAAQPRTAEPCVGRCNLCS